MRFPSSRLRSSLATGLGGSFSVLVSLLAVAPTGLSQEVHGNVDATADVVDHALQVPISIDGDWPAVIAWGRNAADAALGLPDGHAVSYRYAHAMDYLVYAYLQQGDDTAARAAVEEALARGPYEESFISAFHLAAMPARYAVERRDWAAAAALRPMTPSDQPWDRYRWAEAQTWFAKGLGAIESGDLEAVDGALARMERLRDAAAGAGEWAFATFIDIDFRILAARQANAKGEPDVALGLARSAVDLEATTETHPVTPGSYLPPGEALGDLLLAQDDPAEALEAYERSLARWPGRFYSLLGAARAARESGNGAKALEYYRTLMELAGGSDREELAEARIFVSQRSSQRAPLRP